MSIRKTRMFLFWLFFDLDGPGPIFWIIGGGLMLVMLLVVPMGVMHARAQARMYGDVLGVEVSAWDIFWGGTPPTRGLEIDLEEYENRAGR